MKIVISGYGRMGHEVENIVLKRDHEITAVIDSISDWNDKINIISRADAIIDFSYPETAIEVFTKAFELEVPIITGTTGWYDEMEDVKKMVAKYDASFFYAPNFSIGVNIFFQTNRLLAKLSAAAKNYRPSMVEVHHIHKLDAPSGTAIKAANDTIAEYTNIESWVNHNSAKADEMEIISEREGEIIGEHYLTYESDVDEIKISHKAKNRSGFALGAVMAAEFMNARKGFYTMQDLMQDMMS